MVPEGDTGRRIMAEAEGADASEAELQLLRDLLHQSRQEVLILRRGKEEADLRLRAIEGDSSARRAEEGRELEVQLEVREQTRREFEHVCSELARARAANKRLKRQNLDLQYHLSAWGAPVESGEDSEQEASGRSEAGSDRFFPPVSALAEGADPAPVILRGDLGRLQLATLLSLLANDHLQGALTILQEGRSTKLYIEGGLLRLAAWNVRDAGLDLAGILLEADLLQEARAEELRAEGLHDLEVARRLLQDGVVDGEKLRSCLLDHSRVILCELLRDGGGTFVVQEARLECEPYLLFRFPLTDLLLRSAAWVDQESKELV